MKDQSHVIAQGCEDCLKRNPLSLAIQARCPYIYIFAHPRTHEDGVTKRLIWQPRLTKPRAETNSYLFRAVSNSDLVEVCWMIPPIEMWKQYQQGNVTQSADVIYSINMFQFNKETLEHPFQDDVSEDAFKAIMLDIAREMEEQIRIDKMYKKDTPTEFVAS